MFPIDISCLYPESSAPCDLYKKIDADEFVFFAKKTITLDIIVKENLKYNGTNTLYIQNDDINNYFLYVNSQLTNLINNPAIKSERKAEAVYSSCRFLMNKVFDDPRATFVNKTMEVIAPTVDLIISNDQATKHLVKLTAHDNYTYVHSTNVGIFSIALARIFFGVNSAHDMHKLRLGFFLHDLGKCKIPLEILNKPGSFTQEERKEMDRHPEEGSKLLRESGYATEEAETIILQHHERDNGTGYPYGLKGSEIHPYSRICRLADTFEALTSDRPYQRKRTAFEALKLIKESMTDMDQDLLQCFIKLFV
jgi:HD-GYP domain-containing protein (c-di-GMP phosphodiesterase class II)